MDMRHKCMKAIGVELLRIWGLQYGNNGSDRCHIAAVRLARRVNYAYNHPAVYK